MKNFLILTALLCGTSILFSQSKTKEDIWSAETFSNLKFRNIGPALMSGRIADVAINPADESQWYIAVGSGGVWKTNNAGNTFTPIFDGEDCYATGCVTIDPSNDQVIWVGTGENVGGRHASFGCGVYRSGDGGSTWKNMGLPNSEHISKIVVHPDDSNVVWVASQGPLWSKGGERGIYKSVDGGATWKRTLGNEEWTGATELVTDPVNPSILYAATWDRHRTVAAYMGGGPGSGLHKSVDGGDTWTTLTTGLPKSNMGKIGLTLSPQKSNVLYAAIELDQRKGAVYKSTNSGASWTKMSDAVSGATGPHYYQELYACPHNFDRLYLMDVRVQVSDDGGKSFRTLSEKNKHSDNHSISFKASDPDYIMLGTDGGLYESYDLAENWRFFSNLPLTQFYKIAVDDAEPFYNVYGGTQDNSTEGGPSRTDNIQGIDNGDWKVVLNWDGHQPATEPGNPNIMYGQRQEGTLARIDMQTGQVVDIQPQPGAGEDFERYNWDAPILVSPHSPTTIYFASQRLWKSENRGDKWTALSGDLTRNQSRIELPIMGKQQSTDNAWDLLAMSNFNTITAISESPVKKDLLYIGTDDGLIHISLDGGANWSKNEVSYALPDCPKRAYVNNIVADLYDENTVYIALDNHKEGDYKPYIYKSTNQGKSWKSISNNLPSRNLVWRIVQDHVDKDLMFIGTEFGIYFTKNGGQKWTQLKGGLPTISFRDLTIHRRDNDLICGSFGRSIYIFDNIEVFRNTNDEVLESEASLLDAGKGLWYIPRSSLGFSAGVGDQGAGYFMADNPAFGSVFTYYLKDGYKTKKEQRQESEKEKDKSGNVNEFPGWDALDQELSDPTDKIWFTIKNASGKVVRQIAGPVKKGFHRVAWDLRYPAPNTIALNPKPRGERDDVPRGHLVAPGTYTVGMSKEIDGVITDFEGQKSFEVVPLNSNAHKGATIGETTSFWKKYDTTIRDVTATQFKMANMISQVKAIEKAISQTPSSNPNLSTSYKLIVDKMNKLSYQMNGSATKRMIGEKTHATIGDRLFVVSRVVGESTYGPTQTSKDVLQIIDTELKDLNSQLAEIKVNINSLANSILTAGGPMIEGIDVR
ncbi:MAG: photosystem II stability/assembly factor-like uncharacterized protein [Saprospiraceae bacterium]|jgi:photosystem II stability/assembly factor-like uncharacterized protein